MVSAVVAIRILGAITVLYLAGLLLIASYIKRHFKDVWLALGSPGLFNWSVTNSTKLASYIIIKGKHHELGDNRLTLMIYAERIIVVILAVAIVVWCTLFVRFR